MTQQRGIGATERPDDGRETRRLLTVQEAAKTLSIGRSTAYEMIARGELPHVKIGTAVRVPSKALDDWVASNTVGGNN